MALFAWQPPQWSFEYGPIEAPNLDAAKAAIRQKLGVKRLPWGYKVWDIATRPMTVYRVVGL